VYPEVLCQREKNSRSEELLTGLISDSCTNADNSAYVEVGTLKKKPRPLHGSCPERRFRGLLLYSIAVNSAEQ
jgi:hypothetical protein